MAVEERIVIRPDFERQLDKRPVDEKAEKIKRKAEEKMRLFPDRKKEIKKECREEIAREYQFFYNSRLVIAKHNIGSFYSQLYKAIFGGEVLRKFKTEKEDYQNGDEEEQRNFHPDHLRYDGTKKIFCEVKAVSHRNSKPLCASRQLENYCHDLLTDSFNSMFAPELEYAFFRYTHRDDGDKKTNVLANWELARKLARDTRDLLIVPSNLLFLILASSPAYGINQESNKGPDEAHYWKIYGKLITRLHEGDSAPLEIASELKTSKPIAEELFLTDLRKTQTKSPGNVYCSGRRVKPFRVTRYDNVTNRWWEHFKANHERILTQMLGIRDLYDELGEVPF